MAYTDSDDFKDESEDDEYTMFEGTFYLLLIYISR